MGKKKKPIVKKKKSKIQSAADEIERLERSVKRRYKKLEKEGNENLVEKPKHKDKPKTLKEANATIFEMESYLRHTSPKAGIRKAAKIGKKINERNKIEKEYKQVKRLRSQGAKAFNEMIKKPINEELKNRGSRTLPFDEFLKGFTIGSSPNEIKNKDLRKRYIDIYEKDLNFLKNHPKNSGELLVDSKIADYKRDALEQMSKNATTGEYDDAMDALLKMNNKQFALWYAENSATIDALKEKYTENSSHWDAIEALTGSLFESLGLRETEDTKEEIEKFIMRGGK